MDSSSSSGKLKEGSQYIPPLLNLEVLGWLSSVVLVLFLL